jgi:uncharacterized cupin superfamily protein
MPRIRPDAALKVTGSRYPPPFDIVCRDRSQLRLGDAAGLTQFGVNLVMLPPGTWSSQRHWHSHEDEFIYMLDGEAVLCTDQGEEILRAGDCAGFRGGDRNGHCLQNRSSQEVRFLAIGSRHEEDHGEYPDIDLKFTARRFAGRDAFLHKDGSAY